VTAPTTQTVEAEAITNTTAILRGYCWDPGSDTIMYGIFRWRVVGGAWSYGNYIQMTSTNTPGYFMCKQTGLTTNTNYEFEFCGREGDNWYYPGAMTFKTRATAPDGTAGHLWIEGNYLCYLDSAGYKRRIAGEG